MDIKKYTSDLHKFLSSIGDETIAVRQSQYMRNRFPFFGLMKDQQDKYWKEFQEENGAISSAESVAFCRECIQFQEREMWYIGQKTLIKYKSKLLDQDLDFVKNLIIQSDWWDMVDLVSSHIVGSLCKKYPEARTEVDQWIEHDNVWLRRCAIIYQLGYRLETNEDTLYRHILRTCHESEFFIRKAIGWSLREYSKHNPTSVRNFIETNRMKLSNLSIKEGSKYLSN